MDEASVRSVSPSVYGNAAPSRQRRISHERGTRGRSAEPMYNPYIYGGYHGHSRGDSGSPMPKFRSKSHGGQSGSSTEDLHQAYRHWNGPLPPYANFVYQQEVSPSRGGHMRAGHLRTVDSIPTVTAAGGGAADYYQHLVPPSAGSSAIHPLPSGGGRGTHHQRGVSPHDHRHRRAPSGGRGRATAHSGASSRYQSSTDSLIPPSGLPPVPTLSQTTVPTMMNLPPQKQYQPNVMSESEDECANYGTQTHPHLHHQYVSSHHRSGSGGASTTAQAGVYKRSTRRDREKERDKTIDNDRMMKMHQMGAGGLGLSMGGYEEEVAVGGRRGGYGRPAAGGKGPTGSGEGGGRMAYMAPGVPAAGGVKAGGYSPYL